MADRNGLGDDMVGLTKISLSDCTKLTALPERIGDLVCITCLQLLQLGCR